MIQRRPRDLDALSQIPGVGVSKLKRYGPLFIAAIAAHEAQTQREG
jgi:ATP-dependent DNA helicase RecQ